MEEHSLQKFFRAVVFFHALYILVTAVWPLLDIASFMRVTGPKNDLWLVKTVGVTLIPQGFLLFVAFAKKKFNRALATLCLLLCAGLAAIDFYYVSQGTIAKIYLADGAVQCVLIGVYIGWMVKTQ